MKHGYERKQIKDICKKSSSNVAQKDLIACDGEYPIYGASGFIKNVNFFHQDNECIGLVKDGAGVGRVLFLPPKSSVIGTLQYIIPNEGYDIRYVGYCLQSINLTKYSQGATIPHIYFRDYGEEFIVVAADIAEQRRIVDILDAEFAKIDALKENAEKNLQNAKDLFQAVLRQELEPKEGWKTKRLADLCAITSSKRIFKSEYVSEGIPFYRTKEVKEIANNLPISVELFISKEKYHEIKKKFGVPKINDLLVSAVGTIGEIMVINNDRPFYFKDGNLVWLKNVQEVDSYYLKYYLKSIIEKIKSLTRGAAYNALTIERFQEMNISYSPIEEQRTIVHRLDELNKKSKVLEENYQMTLTLCDNLKQALLRKAFNGEL